MFRRIIFVLSSILIVLIIFNFSLVKYVLNMGYHQFRIIYEAEKIEKILNSPLSSDSLKKRLLYVQDIKKFAINSLGLSPSENYNSLYNQHGKAILWNLSACEKYRFKAKLWSFPIAGTFPYKGFFNLNEAKAEAKRLKKVNYDVRIRTVSGWSTLGWFTDPILSNMLNRSDGSLAELIIHELTHSTLFVKNNIKFNENLASFVAENGALLFLENYFGKESSSFQNYIHSEDDYKKYITHVLTGAKILDSLYSSSQFQNQIDSIKEHLKLKYINNIVTTIDTISFFNKSRYEITKLFKPNNAYFMAYRRYNERKNEFQLEFEKNFAFNFKEYLTYLKEKYGEK